MVRDDQGVGVGVSPLLRLVDLTRGETGYLHNLLPLLLPLLLLPLVGSGLVSTRTAALTLSLGVLVGHGLDEGLAEVPQVGAEVSGPAKLLVTVEPGKRQLT